MKLSADYYLLLFAEACALNKLNLVNVRSEVNRIELTGRLISGLHDVAVLVAFRHHFTAEEGSIFFYYFPLRMHSLPSCKDLISSDLVLMTLNFLQELL